MSLIFSEFDTVISRFKQIRMNNNNKKHIPEAFQKAFPKQRWQKEVFIPCVCSKALCLSVNKRQEDLPSFINYFSKKNECKSANQKQSKFTKNV